MRIKLYISLWLDALYSLRFCLKVFPFKTAIKLPVNISRNVRIGNVYKGCIELPSPICHNMLYIGHQGYEAIAEQQGLINIENGSKVVVEGKARLGQGIRLWIESDSTIHLGDNFYCNKNCLLRANANINFGNDSLLGWDIEVNTSDGHYIIENGQPKENVAPIHIGSHVWIASHVRIGKGVSVPDGTVIAASSVVLRSFSEPNTLIGGVPAKVLKENVSWQE